MLDPKDRKQLIKSLIVGANADNLDETVEYFDRMFTNYEDIIRRQERRNDESI